MRLVSAGVTADVVLQGWAAQAGGPEPGSQDYADLQACLSARSSLAGFRASFSIGHAAVPPPSPAPAPRSLPGAGRRRSLAVLPRLLDPRRRLQTAASAPASAAGEATAGTFNGYAPYGTNLTAKSYLLDQAAAAPTPPRAVGPSGPSLVAGLFLHQKRLQVTSGDGKAACAGGRARFTGSLAAVCDAGYSRRPLGSAGGIGVDPVFSVRSPLYRADMAARPGERWAGAWVLSLACKDLVGQPCLVVRCEGHR